MSIRKHIEAADDALRLAIIEALENKRDEQLETMFEALSKVKELILTTPIRGVDNVASYYRNKAEYDFKLDSPYLDDKVVTFPTRVPGGEGEDHIHIDTGVGAADTITFDGNLEDYGYSLNTDVITFGDEQETTRHGKDLDKLDGPE
tara:strand:+ start:873 stop:1313 length:441 start_codon:yes stop_codon:yes gene_type:complete